MPHVVKISKTGEIHEEYVKLREQWEQDRTIEQNEEEAASLGLIQKILLEERREAERIQQEQIKQDEELAKVLSQQLVEKVIIFSSDNFIHA